MADNKLSLFVFIDALGWELMQRHPFMRDALPVQQPLDTIFGYSCTCDPTIITGKMPIDTGHFSFFQYAPERSPFRSIRWMRIFPKSLTSRGRVRHHISKWFKRFYGFTGYFQLYNMPFEHLYHFDYSEKRDLYEPGGINSGAETIFDYLRGHKIPYYISDWRRPEEYNLQQFESVLEQGEVRFAYLYLAAMDAILHQYGTHTDHGAEKIAWYEQQLERVFALARSQYDQVNIHVFSDHGMTNIERTCDLMAQVDGTGLKFCEDYAAVYDSTMARFWFLTDGAREKVEALLNDHPDGRILSREDLEHYGCYFDDDRYGELFFLLKPGILLCPSHMGSKPLAGMHGYAPEDKDSVAAYASNVQAPEAPRSLVDLYRLMRWELEGEESGS